MSALEYQLHQNLLFAMILNMPLALAAIMNQDNLNLLHLLVLQSVSRE